jgi:hypothetical protein
MAKLNEISHGDGCLPNGKQQYLITGGGKITCLRCTATSSRTKVQCGRPAIKTSRTQKCQFHGGRPHTAEVLKRISEANTTRKLPQIENNMKIEASISLRRRDKEVKVHGEPDCCNLG